MGIGNSSEYIRPEQEEDVENGRVRRENIIENQTDERRRSDQSDGGVNTFGSQLFGNQDDDWPSVGLGLRPEDLAFMHLPLSSLRNLTPQLHNTVSIKSPVNLNKESLQIIPKEETGKYNIQFSFDTTSECVVKIIFKAQELFDADTKTIKYKSTSLKHSDIIPIPFGRGLNQSFHSSSLKSNLIDLNINEFTEEEMTYIEGSKNYPIVIVIESVTNETEIPQEKELERSSKDINKKITAQITIANIIKSNSASNNTPIYDLKVITQKILFGGITYVVYDIYGIEQIKYGPTSHQEECVICLSEPRNSVVLPCRHLCLCNQCAEELRYQSNKCPICRGPVRSLLKIEVSIKGNSKDGKFSDKEILNDKNYK